MQFALLLLTLSVQNASQPARQINLRVFDGARSTTEIAAECALRNSKGERGGDRERLRRGAELAWLWSCLPGDVVSCDAPGREPVDITAASCTSPDAQAYMLPARQITLASQASGDMLTVEWLVEQREGLQRLAVRSFTPTISRMNVPVGDGKRVLRVHRRDAAPVTIAIEPEPRSQTHAVPAPQSGGEVFGRVLPSVVIRPQAIAINGNGTSDSTPVDERGYFRFAAIPKGGVYALSPVYKGPVTGTAIRVEVWLARSTDVLPLPLPATGGLSVTIDGSLSAPEARVRASLLGEENDGVGKRHAVRWSASLDPTVTLYEAEGLRPGRYLVELGGENSVLASALAEINVDVHTSVVLTRPRVAIEGRVTISGSRAPAGLLITFANGQREWRATTDDEGRVSLVVDRRGRFSVQIGAAQYLSAVMRTMTFDQEENEFNLDLPGGLLRVHLRRKDGMAVDEPVQIAVTGPAQLGGFVKPGEGTDFLFIGLDYGKYRVTADTASNLVASPANASLTKEQPTATVDLVLEEQKRSVLHVVDPDGRPVHNAQVYAGALAPAEDPVGSGMYPLTRTPVGTEVLLAAPGFLPTCALAETDDWTVSLLRPSAHVSQIRLTPTVAAAIGEVLGAPLSRCPVPLQMLPLRFERDAGGALITINGLPEGQFGYRPRLFVPFSQLVVPGPPIAVAVPPVTGR
jgi:hypothetical protein